MTQTPGGGQSPQPQVTVAPPPASGLAVTSMIFGILSLIGCGLIAGLPAVIMGHMAQGQIKNNPNLGGGGLATAGLVMGYISTALSCIVLGFWLLLVVAGGAAAAAEQGGF